MVSYDLSILIPARKEEFLVKTVEDILANIEANTEIIVVLDGEWSDPGIKQNDRVNVIYVNKSIGQRAATNMACRLASGKYVMKVDAHCSFDKGFDRKLIEEMQDNWTVVPVMRNLHAFDWICPSAHTRYQGPSGPCTQCGKETIKKMIWLPREGTRTCSYSFDSEPHFQYFSEYKKRQIGQLVETMSLQGSCFMLSREKYWQLKICDESFGSWGSQGIEVAVKTWLSGGRVIVNKNTWYAHMFRTQGGDFSFPYEMKGSDQEAAKSKARDLFFKNKFEGQILPLRWLVTKFWPITPSKDGKNRGWTQEELDKLPDLY